MPNHGESRFAKTRVGGRKDGRNKQPIKSGCPLSVLFMFGVVLAIGAGVHYLVEVL